MQENIEKVVERLKAAIIESKQAPEADWEQMPETDAVQPED